MAGDGGTGYGAAPRRSGLNSYWLASRADELPADESWLAPPERARAAGMRFPKRRGEYLLRRYAGKSAVAARLGIPAPEWARIGILAAANGAPYVQVDGRDVGVCISLSDRADVAVALLAPAPADIGIDLELVEPRSAAFVADYLTGPEQAAVRAANEPDVAINLVWSAKEAALKVLGTGLAADTRTVEIEWSGGSGDGIWHPLVARRVRELPSVAEQFRPVITHAETLPRVLPGWWMRTGRFLVTVVGATSTAPPTGLLGSARLAAQ